MRDHRLSRLALPLVVLATTAAAGCATAGSTFRSGVAERVLDDPPYYAGAVPMPLGTVLHLPIAYQAGASHAAVFDPQEAGPVAGLLREMNAYLDSLGATTPLGANEPLRGHAPDVRFGCEQDHLDECIREGGPTAGHGPPWMRLEVGRPSRGWTESLQRVLEAVGSERVLVLTLEVGQYWPDQTNWRGSKEVRLGSGHSVDVPWLTALDRPVQVLQLTGALVDRSGRAHRIGAEGLMARRTHVLLSSLGVQELLTEDDVERLRAARREDLPGQPLVWEVALRNLLAQLTVQPELRAR